MGKKDIVELEMGEDGAYAPKGTVKEKKNKKKEMQRYGYTQNEKPKIYKENHADEFLNGVDVGLDFIDKVVPRVERFFRLRG